MINTVIRLGGGMTPPMYSSNHVSYFVTKPFKIGPGNVNSLSDWSSNTFKQVCLGDVKEFTDLQKEKRDEDEIETYRLVERHMHSLQHYGFPKYQDYSPREREIYSPMML